MTESHRCPHCGAQMKEYSQSLTPGLVSCLIKAIQVVHARKENKFHAERDLNLSRIAYSNFPKLRFHGLVAHFDEETPRSGYWLITARGGQFLRGEIAIPRQVKTFRNRVIGHSEDLVRIGEFRGKVPEFQREFAYERSNELIKTVQSNLI